MCGIFNANMSTVSEPLSTGLAAAGELFRTGDYIAAGESLRPIVAGATDIHERAAALLLLETISYYLRPGRGDLLAAPFGGLTLRLAELGASPELDPGTRARLAAALARQVAWHDPVAGVPLAREALPAAETSGDPSARISALYALHCSLEDPDQFDERCRVSAALLAAAQADGTFLDRCTAHWRCMIDAWAAADSAGYDFHLVRFLSAADSAGDRHWKAMATSARAARALHEGRYDEARSLAMTARESGIPAAINASATQISVAAVDQNAVREVDPQIVIELGANRAHYPPQRVGTASLLMAGGRFTEARAELDLAPMDRLPRDGSYLPAICLYADLFVHLGVGRETEEAARIRLEPYAGRMAVMGDGVACFGPVDLYLGCLAAAREDKDATRTHMMDGYVISARMRGRPWLARMSRDLAMTFGDEEESPTKKWADETLAIAEELGMSKVAAKARELLRAGAPPEPRHRDRLCRELTPREHEILKLLAEGKTAPAIADTLVLSTRTVQKHIEHIYDKIGVQSRHELVAYAFETGLASR